MKKSRLVPGAMLLSVLAAPADGFNWNREEAHAWEAVFPPGGVVISLPRVAAERRLGQVDCLLAELARRDAERAVVVIGMKSCGPCRSNWPRILELARARPSIPFLDLANEANAADGVGVTAFVRYHLSDGLLFGVPAYLIVDKYGRAMSPLTNSLSQLTDWLEKGPPPPRGGDVTTLPSLDAALGKGGAQLITIGSDSTTIGDVLDVIARASGASLDAGDEIRKMPMSIGIVDTPASQLLGLVVASSGLDWASLPPHDGRPAVVRLWRRVTTSERDAG